MSDTPATRPRTRRVRRALLALAALAALGGALEWAVEQVSIERYRGFVESELGKAFGRGVRIGGDLRLEVVPGLRFEARDVTVESAPGRSAPHLLRIEVLRLTLALAPLLERRLEVEALGIEEADLRLETDAEGELDALPDLGRLSGEGAPAGGGFGVRLRRLELRDVQISHHDVPRGTLTTLHVAELEIASGSGDDPLEWNAKGELGGAEFALGGSGGSLEELLHPSEPWPVALSGSVNDAELVVEGRVARPFELSGLELDVKADVPDLARLYAQEYPRLPRLGAARVTGRLVDPDGVRGLEQLTLETLPEDGLRLQLTGSIARLAEPGGVDLDARIEADRLAFLEPMLERPLPAGSLSARLRIGDGDGTLGVDGEVHARSDDASLALDATGAFGDLRAREGLDARFGARSLAELGRALGRAPAWPDAGPLRGSARLRDPGGTLGVERFEVSGGEPGVLSIHASGGIRDLRQIDALAVQAKLEARDLAVVGALLGVELPVRGPVRFEGRVEGSNEQISSQGRATVGGTSVEGTWSGSFATGARPRVDAQLRSSLVRLEDLWLGDDPAPAAAPARARPAPWRDRDPLPFERLRALDVRLAVQAERVTSRRSVDVRNAHLRLALEDGRLDVQEFGVDYQGGRVAGSLRIDAPAVPPRVALRVDALALDLARVGEAFELGDAVGTGQIDAALDLRARGSSPDALLAALDGRAALALRDWTASSAYASRFLLSLRRAFIAGSTARPDPVGCLLGAVDFAGGVGRVERLVLDGERATVDGSGRLDFARDAWDLRLVPTLRDPGLLTVAGAVTVTGPLDAPRFHPLPLDVASGALRGVVRGALSPAKAVTGGAKQWLGPVGRLVGPLDGALELAGGQTSQPRIACALPSMAQGPTTSSTESSPGTPSRSGKP
jgi:hypothetical protein